MTNRGWWISWGKKWVRFLWKIWWISWSRISWLSGFRTAWLKSCNFSIWGVCMGSFQLVFSSIRSQWALWLFGLWARWISSRHFVELIPISAQQLSCRFSWNFSTESYRYDPTSQLAAWSGDACKCQASPSRGSGTIQQKHACGRDRPDRDVLQGWAV